MATTLTRPEIQRPVVSVEPSHSPITLLVVLGAIATALLVFQVAGPVPVDGSHEFAEFGRQTALAPVDESSFEAEHARHTALGTVAATDDSHHVAESARMTRIAPVADDSFERNEATRHSGLSDSASDMPPSERLTPSATG